MQTLDRHIYVVTGHYGTGKSNIAVNLAVKASQQGRETVLVDLDIVNPFFRSADCKEMLQNAGIRTIVPPFANTGADLPALSGQIDTVLRQKELCVILDVGGDDAGAAALGRYAKFVAQETYEMLYVVQQKRFLTVTASEMAQVLAEIEAASHLKATGIINNTNLAWETTGEDIIDSFACVDALCAKTGLPLFATTVRADLAEAVSADHPNQRITPIQIYITNPFETGGRS